MLFEQYIIESMNLAYALWEKQCRFNENYSGFRTMDADIRLVLQEYVPDTSLVQRITKYVNTNTRALMRDAAEFEKKARENLSTFRKSITSSYLKNLDDEADLNAFKTELAALKELYKELLTHLKEMAYIPELFSCRNYLLKDDSYQDIAGVCRRGSIDEVEQKNWSLKVEDYV